LKLMHELDIQIREYMDATSDPLTVDDVLYRRVGEAPVRPITYRSSPVRWWRGWVTAAVAAAVTTIVIGAVAWLAPVYETPSAEKPGVVTAVPDSEATVEVPVSIVAEAVTASSIGDASWTVYEGDSTDIVAGLSHDDAGEVDVSLLDSLMSADGIALSVSGHPVGSAGTSTVHSWRVRVDWIETALASGSVAVSPDEFVRVYGEYQIGQVGEISVLASDALTPIDEHGGTDLADPIRSIAQYEWTSTQDGDRWTFVVVDSLTGEPVGSVTSPFPLMTDGLILTATTAETVELVHPDWFEPGAEYETHYLDVGDSLLAYVKPGSVNNPVAYEVWRTTDGTNWDNVGPPRGFPSGYHPLHIGGGDGFYFANLDDITEQNDPGPDFLTIGSQNGIDWVLVDGLPEVEGSTFRMGAGWVFAAWPMDSPTLSIFTSTDGTNWDPIDTSGIPGPFMGVDGGAGPWRSSGNTLFTDAYRDSPPLERLWVVRFP
jgi:hypothetical protein